MNGPTTAGSWRDPILAHFTPEIAAVARLTIVADPDELLTERGLVDRILKRGFEIIPFEDHVAFRYAYERRFRQAWDAGTETDVVVVLRAARSDIATLPYDLLHQARRDQRLFSFSLGELFPSLAPHVLADLDRTDLDAVYAAQELLRPGPLGEDATRDFLLTNVFRIDHAHIQTDADLLRMLLRRHYSKRIIPTSLDDRLLHLLRASSRWGEWPLEQIVPNRVSFLEFLQERWPIFLRRTIGLQAGDFGEASKSRGRRFGGRIDLPFDHDDIRVYVDNLFTDGLLARTDAVASSAVQGTWMAAGVVNSEDVDHLDRFRKLLQSQEEGAPDAETDHHGWVKAAFRWAELVALRWSLPGDLPVEDRQRFSAAHDHIEAAFQDWLSEHYASLHSLSFLPRPVMLHQIPRYLAHRAALAGGPAKLAVVVVDGLAMDQWAVARQTMPTEGWVLEESGLFAWVPSLTAVSRQAIFAADPPFYFATSIGTTRKEEAHWIRFWEDRDLRRNEIVYMCQGAQEADRDYIGRIHDKVRQPKCRIAGIVIGTVDQMLHGVVTGTDGLHAGVRHWAQRGALWRVLELLADLEFEIVLTADHGNVEGIGFGKPDVGTTASERGERAHVFSDEVLRSRVAAEFPGAIPWPAIGLPDDYLPLIAPPRRAFIGDGKRTVAHGGACVEELIVPFVTLARVS